MSVDLCQGGFLKHNHFSSSDVEDQTDSSRKLSTEDSDCQRQEESTRKPSNNFKDWELYEKVFLNIFLLIMLFSQLLK